MTPRVLVWDLENSPAVGEFWGATYNTNIIRVIKPQEVISFAAKWHGERAIEFRSDFHDGHEVMVARARELLDEADYVVSYNGIRHDTPHMNTSIKVLGLSQPSPYKHIDLYQAVRRVFKFQQNRLAFVAQQLLDDTKAKHQGHALWVACGEGDPKAWATMRFYNMKDVRLTDRLYEDVKGWLPASMRIVTDRPGQCDRCLTVGRLQKRGTAPKGLSLFPRFQCQACGGWMTGKKAVATMEERGL